MELRILSYKELRDTFILGPVDDLTTALDESLVSVNMILGSRFVGPIREPVDGVYKRLLLLQVRREEREPFGSSSLGRVCCRIRQDSRRRTVGFAMVFMVCEQCLCDVWRAWCDAS